jgi:hypothetical protein
LQIVQPENEAGSSRLIELLAFGAQIVQELDLRRRQRLRSSLDALVRVLKRLELSQTILLEPAQVGEGIKLLAHTGR